VDVIYVARQLGHGAELTLRTYGHVIEELEDSPQLPAEEAIERARREVGALTEQAPSVPAASLDAPSMYPSRTARRRRPPPSKRPGQDSNLRPTP
jgi:hypothetical protein